jgi:hypothetical protein
MDSSANFKACRAELLNANKRREQEAVGCVYALLQFASGF